MFEARLRHAAATLERILTDNILAFWERDILDLRDGGYHVSHDGDGRRRGRDQAPRRLVTQARVMWFFSAVARSPVAKPWHLDAAGHGYRFLREHLLDPTFGGYYWEVGARGEITCSDKHLYGQAFALYALCEYADAAADTGAREHADMLWALMEDRAHDADYGGYTEAFTRAWHVSSEPCGALGHPPGHKLFNTHLHILEALMRYYALSGDATVRERLIELIHLLSHAVVRHAGPACTDVHEADWKPVAERGRWRVSYGHDLENIWLLIDACHLTGLPVAGIVGFAEAVFEHALRHGFDRRRGGFYQSGPVGGRADRRSKIWWVQAEGLVAALTMYQCTGHPRYLECFERTLAWISERQVDWTHGEWHAGIDRRGKPFGDKAGPWKGPYHNGRAMLECLQRLQSIVVGSSEQGASEPSPGRIASDPSRGGIECPAL